MTPPPAISPPTAAKTEMMANLAVIARDGEVALPHDALVLRLVGLASSTELAPNGILHDADAASAEIKNQYPNWLWQWAMAAGVFDFGILPDGVSWWWFTPISEKSPLRMHFIRELYWLCLLRRVIRSNCVSKVQWFGDDELLARVAATIAVQEGCAFTVELACKAHRNGRLLLAARRFKWSLYQVANWCLLKALRIGTASRHADAIFYTRFPILWQGKRAAAAERMFGNLPATLGQHGVSTGYIAAFAGSPWQIITQHRTFRATCHAHRISFAETELSLGDLIRILCANGVWRRYSAWRVSGHAERAQFLGLKVGTLFARELDESTADVELHFCRIIAAGIRKHAQRNGAPRVIFHPFEYQPMERAIKVASRDSYVVGIQTGLFTTNQMGFALLADELEETARVPHRAPAPDYIAAYGTLPAENYARRLGSSRVCLCGPIRYPALRGCEKVNVQAFRAEIGVDPEATMVVVATPIAPEEAFPIVSAVLEIAAHDPRLFVLFKFHYHLPLHAEVTKRAKDLGFARYRIFDADLYKLMSVSAVMISGGSSTCVEAIGCGCMPVAYRSPAEMSPSPLLEVADSGYFWYTSAQLRGAIRSCIEKDAQFQGKRATWPDAIRQHLYAIDGQASERLYEFLHERGILR